MVDGDLAQGQLHSTAYHWTAGQEVVVLGRYLDTYRRDDGVWCIQHRSLVTDGGGSGFIGKGVAAGAKDRSDPVFTRLDLFS